MGVVNEEEVRIVVDVCISPASVPYYNIQYYGKVCVIGSDTFWQYNRTPELRTPQLQTVQLTES